MSSAVVRGLRVVGRLTIDGVWRLGAASRFMSVVLLRSATTFRRFRLLLDEVYFAGALSLIIIVVSGLLVGWVLGLQGYETLKRYGSAEAPRLRHLLRMVCPRAKACCRRQPVMMHRWCLSTDHDHKTLMRGRFSQHHVAGWP